MDEIKKNDIPWVEKYRPTHFDNIVLDPINRQLFEKIIQKKQFPNLLFYGPPGTGKTTTIINLIQQYQKKYGKINTGNVIHLNASDERGIDIIRNQIHSFVKSMNLFETGFKFVILDEVDYMTKNAQQALKYLLQTTTTNVRFCLICNYISKIDEPLKNEFICDRFNQ
jgi:replication factor C subunit 3/5